MALASGRNKVEPTQKAAGSNQLFLFANQLHFPVVFSSNPHRIVLASFVVLLIDDAASTGCSIDSSSLPKSPKFHSGRMSRLLIVVT